MRLAALHKGTLFSDIDMVMYIHGHELADMDQGQPRAVSSGQREHSQLSVVDSQRRFDLGHWSSLRS